MRRSEQRVACVKPRDLILIYHIYLRKPRITLMYVSFMIHIVDIPQSFGIYILLK